MPYTRSGKCVYKKKADGSQGKKKGCSDSEEKAKKYMSKLYSLDETDLDETDPMFLGGGAPKEEEDPMGELFARVLNRMIMEEIEASDGELTVDTQEDLRTWLSLSSDFELPEDLSLPDLRTPDFIAFNAAAQNSWSGAGGAGEWLKDKIKQYPGGVLSGPPYKTTNKETGALVDVVDADGNLEDIKVGSGNAARRYIRLQLPIDIGGDQEQEVVEWLWKELLGSELTALISSEKNYGGPRGVCRIDPGRGNPGAESGKFCTYQLPSVFDTSSDDELTLVLGGTQTGGKKSGGDEGYKFELDMVAGGKETGKTLLDDGRIKSYNVQQGPSNAVSDVFYTADGNTVGVESKLANARAGQVNVQMDFKTGKWTCRDCKPTSKNFDDDKAAMIKALNDSSSAQVAVDSAKEFAKGVNTLRTAGKPKQVNITSGKLAATSHAEWQAGKTALKAYRDPTIEAEVAALAQTIANNDPDPATGRVIVTKEHTKQAMREYSKENPTGTELAQFQFTSQQLNTYYKGKSCSYVQIKGKGLFHLVGHGIPVLKHTRSGGEEVATPPLNISALEGSVRFSSNQDRYYMRTNFSNPFADLNIPKNIFTLENAEDRAYFFEQLAEGLLPNDSLSKAETRSYALSQMRLLETRRYAKSQFGLLRERLIIEELTGADRSEIKRMIKKEIEGTTNKREIEKAFQKKFDVELKKALGTSFLGTPGKINKFVIDQIYDEVNKWLADTATRNEIAEITKQVLTKLYRELSFSSPTIIKRIKV